MTKPLRIQYEGYLYYHALSKGNSGEYIFAEDRDKEYFINREISRVTPLLIVPIAFL